MIATHTEKKREDPRVKRTRKLINQAFFDLMNEKGFQAITIQDIADRAEVNRATFYAHYEDKYDLLDSYAREGFRGWLNQKCTSEGAFSLERLHQLVATVFESLAAMDAHCGTPDKQIEPMLEAAVQEELADFLFTWFAQAGAFPDSLTLRQEPQTVALVWSWSIFGAGVQWSRGNKSISAAVRAAEVIAVLTAPLGGNGEPHSRQAEWVQA